jgi:molybdopterin synthase sulfur carrier subunit
MAIVWIPPLLHDLTGGQESVRIEGGTIRHIIAALEQTFPGIRDRLCDGSGLRPGIAVVIDTEVSRLGLAAPVGHESEVHFLPAISGGASCR